LLHGILQVQVLSSAAPEKAQFLLAGRVLWRLLTAELRRREIREREGTKKSGLDEDDGRRELL